MNTKWIPRDTKILNTKKYKILKDTKIPKNMKIAKDVIYQKI